MENEDDRDSVWNMMKDFTKVRYGLVSFLHCKKPRKRYESHLQPVIYSKKIRHY